MMIRLVDCGSAAVEPLTRRRPVLDVASDVHHSVLLTISGGAKGVALTDTHSVRGGHRVSWHVANLHANDEASPRTHAHTHGG